MTTKLEWRNCSAYVICIVPEGKMYAYAMDSGDWYIPLVATVPHDGILPAKMAMRRFDTASDAVAAMEQWYFNHTGATECPTSSPK